MNKDKVIELLTNIFDLELNGIIRYTHYSLMIFGPNRIPLVVDTTDGNKIKELPVGDNLDLTNSSLLNATSVQTQTLSIGGTAFTGSYTELTNRPTIPVENKSIALEEYCRTMICAEEQDYNEMIKMLNE